MPSKKANKAAKKPGKAVPKTAVVKKAARASPGHISKVPVKAHKPTPKSTPVKHDTKHDSKQDAPTVQARPKSPAAAPAKPASAAPNGPAVAAEKATPTIKFDSRPLVIPTRTPPPDEDGEESSG